MTLKALIAKRHIPFNPSWTMAFGKEKWEGYFVEAIKATGILFMLNQQSRACQTVSTLK